MSKKSQKKNKYITPMNVHVKGLKDDLKIYQKQILEFKKGIKKDGWNTSSITLADFLEAVHNARLLIFLLEECLTGKVYKKSSGKYDWESDLKIGRKN